MYRHLLKFNDFHLSFRLPDGTQSPALRGMDLRLLPGEAKGLVGESGSGKTLTALAVMQLLPRQPGMEIRGQIEYWPADRESAVDLMTLGETRMQTLRGREISMVFQEPMHSLHPVFRCGDQIREVLRRHQLATEGSLEDEVLQWLERMKLRDPKRIYRSYPHQLSGGQIQRVMLAMALCTRPRLLLADEPTTALDATVQREFMQLLTQLRQEMDLSILFISHDLGVVREFCDSVDIIKDGDVLERGSVKCVFEGPNAPYTRGLMACRPPMHRKLERLPELETVVRSRVYWPEVKVVRSAPPPASEEKPPLLQVQDLDCIFYSGNSRRSGQRRVHAVNQVSFSLSRGETLGVVGESGSGKTTLARCILGLQSYQEGIIRFKGRVLDPGEEQGWKLFRQLVQPVFQDPFSSLQPRMSVGEAIREPLKVYRKGSVEQQRERVVELLDQVGLGPQHYQRYPHEFSGGQRQRVAIARALAFEPELLICDESVSSLDVSIQAQILNLLKELQETMGLSLLFITHDLPVVRFLAHRVLVINQGQVVEEGLVDEVFTRPKAPYTAELLSAVPKVVQHYWY